MNQDSAVPWHGARSSRLSRPIWRATLNTLNEFPRLVEKSSPGHGLRVEYCKGETSGRVVGLFNETDMTGMFKSSDYKALDMVPPFIGAIVNQLCRHDCGLIKIRVLCTLTFSAPYIGRSWPEDGREAISKLSQKYRWLHEWRLQSFCKLPAVRDENREVSFPWSSYEDVLSVSSIEYLHKGLYEATNKGLEKAYDIVSKSHRSVNQEWLKQILFSDYLNRKNKKQHWHRKAKTCIEAEICSTR